MVLKALKLILKRLGVNTWALYQKLSAASLNAAARQQGLSGISAKLRSIVPDIMDQYSAGFDRRDFDAYWEIKLRHLHAFQIRCVLEALESIGRENLVVVDIGDSSGTHGIYLEALAPANTVSKFISVNLDPVAVEKIRAKGRTAVLCRAEELGERNIHADLYISFEMLEHLFDPATFLHDLAQKESAGGGGGGGIHDRFCSLPPAQSVRRGSPTSSGGRNARRNGARAGPHI